MIFQNTVVRFIAFFIPVKDIRDNFIKSYSRKTKFAKLRNDNKLLLKQNKHILNDIKQLYVENIETKKRLQRIETILTNNSFMGLIQVPTRPVVYLSILVIAKNEAPYLKEWIEYHKLVGVERFYFYDNDSTDNTKEVLKPYINDGTVIYHEKPGKKQMMPAYLECIHKYGRETRWLAIIDMDEFIVPVEKDSISDFLRDYEKYSAVGVNWIMFDSNGHKTKPNAHGGMLSANYTRVEKDYKDKLKGSLHIKSIVNPKVVVTIVNPHYAIYKGGAGAVTENFETVYGPFTNIHSSSKIQINHYFTKSEEEYKKRCNGGKPDSLAPKNFRENALNHRNPTNDYTIQKFLPRLKLAMGVKD